MVTHFVEIYGFQEQQIRFYILQVLLQLKADPGGFLSSLKGEEEYMLKEVSRNHWNYDPYQEITSLTSDQGNLSDEQFMRPNNQLDILWGTFFASGLYKPIKTLIEILKLRDFSDYPDKYQGKLHLPGKTIKNVQLGLAFQAAKMSLGKYCSEFPLVRTYCAYYLNCENPPESLKTELNLILGS